MPPGYSFGIPAPLSCFEGETLHILRGRRMLIQNPRAGSSLLRKHGFPMLGRILNWY